MLGGTACMIVPDTKASAVRRLWDNLALCLSRPLPAALLIALFNFVLCYLRFFLIPWLPRVVWGDQLGFFNDGSRMALGQLPYRDYFQFVAPGTDLVYALLVHFFGVRLWIPNLLMACLAALAAFLTTLIASHVLRGAAMALPGLFLAGFILPVSADATHHWFSTVAVLAALLVLLDGTTLPRVAAAGALCGVAACFTQTKGAMALAAFVLYLEVFCKEPGAAPAADRWRKILALGAAAAAVFLAVNAHYVLAAGFQRWLFCLIVFPLRYYPAPMLNNWRVVFFDFQAHWGPAAWACLLFVYATVPWVYAAFGAGWRKWKKESGEQWSKLLLVALTGFAIFLSVASSPSAKRLGSLSLPAMILLAWFLQRAGKAAAASRILLAGAAAVLAVAGPVRTQIQRAPWLDLPGGRAAIAAPDLYTEYSWLLENTHPGEYSFGLPPLYSAFHLLNPAAIEGLAASEYTRPEQVTALVDALESHQVPLLILPHPEKYFWVNAVPGDSLGPLRDYVRRNYRLTKTFATGDEVWARINPTQSGRR